MSTKFPNGVEAPFFAGGVPGSDVTSPFPMPTTGRIFYVDSTNGNDGNTGKSPTAALATIAQAHSLVTSNAGDVIYLMPGHSETYASAAAISLTKSGFSVIGVGYGTRRPVFYAITATTATFAVSGSNVMFKNVKWDSATGTGGIDAVATALDVTAGDGLVLDGCHFIQSVAGGSVIGLRGVTIAAACDDVTIQNCRFYSPVLKATEAIRIVGSAASERHSIKNNYIFGNYLTACINNITSGCRGLEIFGNTLVNKTTRVTGTSGVCIRGHASTTGHISYNSGQAGNQTTVVSASIYNMTGCTYAENYFANLVNERGAAAKAVST